MAVEVQGGQVLGGQVLGELGTGAIVSGGTLHNATESLIKIWLAVDFLAARKSRIPADNDATATR